MAAATLCATFGFSGRAAADEPPADPRALLGAIHRIVTPAGVDEAKAVRIGGIDQWITVRGKDRRQPILLLLHGGPAAPELSTRFLFEPSWVDYFTVVQWDQRGAGKTMALNDPDAIGPTITEDRLLADAEELVAYLRKTYGQQKIFLVGHSWGSILGLRLAQRHPAWFHAYVGAGQIIDMQAGEAEGFRFALDEARRRGDAEALTALRAIAPYPPEDGSLPLASIGTQRKFVMRYGGLLYGRESYSPLAQTQQLSPDYSDEDLTQIDAGSRLTLPRLLPAMAKTTFGDVHCLEVPVVIFAGRHDQTTPSNLAANWLANLRAPAKKIVWFENSAHMMFVEEPGRTLVALVQDVLPLATGPKPGPRLSDGHRGDDRQATSKPERYLASCASDARGEP